MADEIIGSLGVQIEADASDLPGQFDAAVESAQNAGERISSAFESFVGIGEALAITEGLKEFGSEALNAFASEEKISIGLTALSGSAEAAADAMEALKVVASNTGVAEDTMLGTAQKLAAAFGTGGGLVGVLQAAANASAATGSSFEGVASALERVQLTGQVSARQLVALGLSWQDLADTMGVSVTEAEEKLKKGGQDAAQDVQVLLDTINKKFGDAGTALGQGLAGQFNAFKNQIDNLMQDVGKALAPVISDLLQFASNDILPSLKELLEAFNALPGPVKDTAAGLALAVAAIAPLFAGVGLLGQGLIGVQAIMGPVNELLVTMGIREEAVALATAHAGEAAVTTAPEIQALAVAQGEEALASTEGAFQLGLFQEELAATAAEASVVGTQFSLLGPEIGSIAVGSETAATGLASASLAAKAFAVGLAAIGAVAIFDEVKGISGAIGDVYDSTKAAVSGLIDLNGTLEDLQPTIRLVEDEWQKTQTLISNSSWADYLAPQFAAVKKALQETAQAINELSGTWPGMAKAAEDAADRVKAAADKIAHDAAVAAGGFTGSVYSQAEAALKKLTDAQSTLDNELAVAQQALALAAQGYKDGSVSASVYQAALNAVDELQKKVNAGNKDYQDTLAGLTETYDKQQATINTLENTISQLLSVENRTAAQTDLLNEAENRLAAINKQVAESHNLVKVAAQGQGSAYDNLVTSGDKLLEAQLKITLSVSQAKAVLDQLNASTDTSVEHQRAVIAATQQYGDALLKAGGDINTLIGIQVNGVTQFMTIGQAISKAKDNLGDFHTTTVTVAKEGPAFVTMLGNIAVESVPAAGGLRNISDQATETIKIITSGVTVMSTLSDTIAKQPGLLTDLSSKYFSASAAAQQMVSSQSNLDIEYKNAKALVDALSNSGDAQGLTMEQQADRARALSDAIKELNSLQKQLGQASDSASASLTGEGNSLSQFASDVANAGGSLSQFASDASSSMGEADDAFTTALGSVNALSFGVQALAFEMSGLAIGAGSGGIISAESNPADLQHQLWLAQHPDYSDSNAQNDYNKNILSALAAVNTATTATSTSVESLSKATSDLGTSSTTAADDVSGLIRSLNSIGSSSTTTTTSANAVTTSFDQMSNTFNETAPNIDFAGLSASQLSDVIKSLGDQLSTVGITVDQGTLSNADYAKELQSTVDQVNAATDATNHFTQAAGSAASGIQSAAAAIAQASDSLSNTTATTSSGGGYTNWDGSTYASYADFLKAVQQNPALLPHQGDLGVQNALFSAQGTTYNGPTYSINGQQVGLSSNPVLPQGYGPGGSSTDLLGYGQYQGAAAQTPGFGYSPSGNQGTVVNLTMQYPQFNSQQQATKIFNDQITMLRTVAGLKVNN